MLSEHREACEIDRRKLILGAAGTLASAGLAKSLAWPSAGGAAVLSATQSGPLPAPDPIPGGLGPGLPVPGGIIHVFLPGPPSVTLPFSNTTLMGLNVEPSTITNFKGSSAVAFVIGTAKGSDGKTYNLEVDIRALEGEYVAGGATQRGAFALI
jgi:hypothetical protein